MWRREVRPSTATLSGRAARSRGPLALQKVLRRWTFPRLGPNQKRVVASGFSSQDRASVARLLLSGCLALSGRLPQFAAAWWPKVSAPRPVTWVRRRECATEPLLIPFLIP